MDRRNKRLRSTDAAADAEEVPTWRIEQGEKTLRVHFVNKDGAPSSVNLTRWLSIGDAARDFAEAFARTYADKKQAGRYAASQGFASGALKYMIENGIVINSPTDLPLDFISTLRDHFKRTDEATRHPILAPNTQSNYLKSIALLVPKLHQIDNRWKVMEVPRNLYPRSKASAPPKTVDTEGVTEALVAAAQDTLNLMRNLWPRLAAVRSAHAELMAGATVAKNTPEGLVAHVLFDNQGNFPAQYNLGINAGKWSMEQKVYIEHRRLAYPIGVELIPLYLLLASSTGFNGQPLNCLELSGIQRSNLLGQHRLNFTSKKNRGGARGRPGSSSTVRWGGSKGDNALSPHNIVEFLLDWTALLREYADEPLNGDLFLHFVAEGGRYAISGFRCDSYACRTDNINTRITNYILEWCKSRGVKYCGTSLLRLGMAQIIDEASDGDARELRNLLGHALVGTGQDHYRTTDMLRRSKEQLAGGMATQQRWVTSKGKIDTRSKPSYRDSTAATPGFSCADPFDSPLPHQVQGRLCTAYGLCPVCPLAGADPDEVYAFARMLQLKEAFESAKGTLGIVAWKLKYEPSFKALTERWIPLLDTPQSRDLGVVVVLSRLPAIE